MTDKHLLIGLTVATGLLVYRFYKDKHENKLSLPPSPRSYPLIGHLLSFPSEFEHLGFEKLGEQLGSKIVSLSVFGTTMIVLNDIDDAVNLLEKRSAIYSDRTCPPMVQDPSLFYWADVGSIIAYGDRWRRFRRLMTPLLTKQATSTHHESQEQATRRLVQRLLKSHNVIESSHESIAATMFRSLYGYEVESSEDPLFVRTHKIFSYLVYALQPSNYTVNTIPALRHVPDWFPGTGWKREAAKWRREKESVIDELYGIGIENAKKDKRANNMVADLRSQALKLGLTEEEADEDAKQVAITLIGGMFFVRWRISRTVNTLMMCFLAMVLYPDVQKKAQQELDTVIGDNRLPSFKDQDQLGCIERIIQETLRWHPVSALGTPHTCQEDDTYKGYRIPKGAIVAGNVWAMTHNETMYKDPEVFNPDRFLDPSTPPSPVFGWGRRRCPGIRFAQASLYITLATILMTFNIGVAQDKDGKDIIPSGKLVNALVLTPQQFRLKLIPRSTKHEELIRRTF
ncbi:cytochrome P450 [Rhizoctonia solani]|nr:cytochrome P450 [Rhizoctonia solani]